jgi:DnaJ-class molecular chaperone
MRSLVTIAKRAKHCHVFSFSGFYQALGLQEHCTEAEVDSAYQKFLSEFGDGETYDEVLDPLGYRLAYDTLRDAEKREDYDFFLSVSIFRQKVHWD